MMGWEHRDRREPAKPPDAMEDVMKLLGVLAAAAVLMGAASAEDEIVGCGMNGKVLKGKVQVVTSGADFKVQIVTSFPDLKVKMVESFPDDCGEWQMVESFPDFTVEYVTSFPDFKIQMVESFPGEP
jgi:hypothetical protein